MGSVANTTTENEVSPGSGFTRPNPVALETLVTVTGAKPSSEGARDLFTEETRTILVFVDGVVIQLASPVSEGQLLFLTNKKSNEEVVCQVLHKKLFGASTCYVELQFTEDKPNYWGVAFPKGKQRGAEFTAAEHVAAEQTTEQSAASPAPAPHNEKDAEDLKAQVEALRKQLAELEQKNAEEAAAKAVAERAAAEEHAAAEAAIREAEEAKASAAKAKQELSSATEGSAEKGSGESLLMPPSANTETKPPAWTVKMALPMQAKEPRQNGEADSLPKPELDFSHVPQTAAPEEIALRASLKGSHPWREKVRLAGLVVVLAAVGFGAYEKLAPYVLSVAKKAGSSSSAAKVAAAPVKAAAGPKASPGAAAPAVAIGSATGSHSAVPEKPNVSAQASAPKKDAGTANAAPAASSDEREGTPARAAEALKETGVRPVTMAKERAEKKTTVRERAAESVPTEVALPDGPVIPAKLLRGATPVYPPDAMRSYITGDVKAELVVEASGKVGEVKVISGPSALRQAALEALKKYEYEAATQGGKKIASKTTAVVKFWFNP